MNTTTALTPRGAVPLTAPVSADDLLTAFADFLRLDVAQGDASPETVRSYFGIVRQYAAWCATQGVNPAQATTADLKVYRAHLIDAGYQRTTIATKINALRRFYAMAHARGYRLDNPAAGVQAPPDRTDRVERVKWLPLSAVPRLLQHPAADTVRGQRDRAILGLLVLHGLRVAEAALLDVGDVDLDAGTVGLLGKGHKRRTILLVSESAALVRAWLAVRPGVAAPGETALFVTLHHGRETTPGARLTTRAIRKLVDAHLADLGLKRAGVSCHALRHSYATLSRAAGAKLDAISRSLGHASVSTTQIYADIVDRAAENPARFLVGALDSLGE